ncbi:site-2 protease family protein [Sulfurimonas sp. SAG-AH-194-I05]|nr:site-2 protease family protein [Sulfurimonas sp. SAG-AH-194-I05]MDF1874885.1 site-2 protease family protein [Sulfurimonas sp. SAG-AH-194-I05]
MESIDLLKIAAAVLALAIAVIGHEIMHGYVAYAYGESGFLFGWAKPVPINTATVIKNAGYNGAMQVDLAGIVYNFTLGVFASIAIIAMDKPTTADDILYIFAYIFVFQLLIINVVLGVFNLLPIPQFDGAHFVSHLALKYKINSVAEFFYKNEKYGIIVVFIILMTPLKDYVLMLPVQTILGLLLTA